METTTLDIDFNNPTDTKKEILTIESPFNFDELFFSVTDERSEILFANDVFLRVAKYSKEEILGEYHKVIRHPDMPKAAFRILWKFIQSGKSVAVYVKNKAKDGSYYWVIALVFPCECGYLSIRLKPSSTVFDLVKQLYSETLDYESNLESKGAKREDVVNESEKYLIQKLQKAGYRDYEEFMQYALLKEMYEREHMLGTFNQKKEKRSKTLAIDTHRLATLETILTEMVYYSNELHGLHKKLLIHSGFLLNLSKTIQAISQNARLQSSKLDKSDQSLFVVSEKMGEQTHEGEIHLDGLISSISDLRNLFSALNFEIISSKLQVEMTEFYKEELTNNEPGEDNQVSKSERVIGLLHAAFEPRLRQLNSSIQSIPKEQSKLLDSMTHIERFLTVLKFIYMTGKVEISRMGATENMFMETFEELSREITKAEDQLTSLRNVLLENGNLFTKFSSFNTHIEQFVK